MNEIPSFIISGGLTFNGTAIVNTLAIGSRLHTPMGRPVSELAIVPLGRAAAGTKQAILRDSIIAGVRAYFEVNPPLRRPAPAQTAKKPVIAADSHSANRALWKELHLHALLMTAPPVPVVEGIWVGRWLAKLGGCSACLNDAAAWISANPPDVSSSEALFAWSVSLHNYVNRKIGKAEWTLPEAISHYRTAA